MGFHKLIQKLNLGGGKAKWLSWKDTNRLSKFHELELEWFKRDF